MKITQPSSSLRSINNFLFILIIIINLATLMQPLLPWIANKFSRSVNVGLYQNPSKKDLANNKIIIPSIKLDKKINEGKNLAAANTGPWRLPYTSTPKDGGNTVIIGHRFSYVNPAAASFYMLDGVKLKDKIYVIYDHKMYQYKVVDIKVVPPSEISVEAKTDKPRLTLYTCTPLWTATHRLVITAEPSGRARS